MIITLQLIERSDGPTKYDGQYVVDYDPKPRTDATGEYVYLRSTANRADAKQFESTEARQLSKGLLTW